MARDLFDKDLAPRVTTLSKILMSDFDSFVSNPNTVSSEYASTIDMYENYGEIPFYHLYPSFNTATGNKEYRFLLIEIDNRKWLYRYKIVRIVTTKQIRFFGLPTTDGAYVVSDVERIIDALSCFSFVRFVFSGNQRARFENMLGGKRVCQRLWNHDEFFYHIDRDNVDFTSNRWRKKHYVNLLNRESAFVSEVTDNVFIPETNVLRDTWKIGMAAKGDAVRQSTERSFQNFIRNADKDVLRVISLRYNGRLIAQEIFLLDKPRKVCQSLYCIHVFDYGDDPLLKHIVNRMVAIQKYLSWVYLRNEANTVYVGTGANKALYGHKERTCDGKVEYYII